MSPLAGHEYPRSCAQLRAWFDEDWKCLDYVDWLRWPGGLVCPNCNSLRGWRAADRRWRCAGYGRRVSVTSGTIFDVSLVYGRVVRSSFPAKYLPFEGRDGDKRGMVRVDEVWELRDVPR